MSDLATESVPEDFHGFLPASESTEPDRFIDRYTDGEEYIRVVGFYSESMQEWTIRKQAFRDGKWKTSGWAVRLDRNGPDDHPDRVQVRDNRFVKNSYGAFSGLSLGWRILGAPLYALWFAVLCLRGRDVTLQTLHSEEWLPDE